MPKHVLNLYSSYYIADYYIKCCGKWTIAGKSKCDVGDNGKNRKERKTKQKMAG